MFSSVERKVDLYREVLESTTSTADTGTGSAVRLPDAQNAYVFLLDVAAAATETADKLDVWVQTRINDTWVDILQFTQHDGDGGAAKYVGKVEADGAVTTFTVAALASEGAVRAIHGDAYRARWAITDASTDNASFTFSVSAIPM